MDGLLTTVISAGLSAVVSYYVAIYTKEKEYKNEYYKKVIDKRIKSYEMLEAVLRHLTFVYTEADGTPYYDIYRKQADNYASFIKDLTVCLHHSTWLGYNAALQLKYLNQLIHNSSKGVDKSDSEQLRNAGKANFNSLKSMVVKLEEFMKADYFNLHDVEKFFSTRR